jgi:hypothetical protein
MDNNKLPTLLCKKALKEKIFFLEKELKEITQDTVVGW